MGNLPIPSECNCNEKIDKLAARYTMVASQPARQPANQHRHGQYHQQCDGRHPTAEPTAGNAMVVGCPWEPGQNRVERAHRAGAYTMGCRDVTAFCDVENCRILEKLDTRAPHNNSASPKIVHLPQSYRRDWRSSRGIGT